MGKRERIKRSPSSSSKVKLSLNELKQFVDAIDPTKDSAELANTKFPLDVAGPNGDLEQVSSAQGPVVGINQGDLRRSSRPRGPPKDPFANDFVGEQWTQMRCSQVRSCYDSKVVDGLQNLQNEAHFSATRCSLDDLRVEGSKDPSAIKHQVYVHMEDKSAGLVRAVGLGAGASTGGTAEEEEEGKLHARLSEIGAGLDVQLSGGSSADPYAQKGVLEMGKDCTDRPIADFSTHGAGHGSSESTAGHGSLSSNANACQALCAALPACASGHCPACAPAVQGACLVTSVGTPCPPGPAPPNHSSKHDRVGLGLGLNSSLFPNSSNAESQALLAGPVHDSPCTAHPTSSQANPQSKGVASWASLLMNSEDNAISTGPTSNNVCNSQVDTTSEGTRPIPVGKLEAQHGQADQVDYVSHFQLSFFKHEILANEQHPFVPKIKAPESLVEEGKIQWGTTLVGNFIGKMLPYTLVSTIIHRLWDSKGLVDLLATDSGFYFFKFSHAKDRDAVLEAGPWFIAGRPLLLRQWHPNLVLDSEGQDRIPIWVNFFDVPLEYWNPKGISFIASMIGKPLHVDRMTASCRRISYARVCIEVSAEQDLISEFDIEADDINGSSVLNRVRVEYQWKPPRCAKCLKFGHVCTSVTKADPTSKSHNHFRHKDVVGVWKAVTKKESENEWQVVKGRDKGKRKIEDVGYASSRKLDIRPEVSAEGNSYAALSFEGQVSDALDTVNTLDTVAFPPPSRLNCHEASPSHHPPTLFDDTREASSSPLEGDVDDCDINFEDGISTPATSISARQRKREAKMKFSGSRPRGRHRP